MNMKMARIIYLMTCVQLLTFSFAASLPQNASHVIPKTTLTGLSSFSHRSTTNTSNVGPNTTSARVTTTESTTLPFTATSSPKTTLLSIVNRRLEDLQKTKTVETIEEDISQVNFEQLSSAALADLILINYLQLAQQEGVSKQYQSGFGIVPQRGFKRQHQTGSEYGHTTGSSNFANKKKAWNWPKY